MSPKKRLYWTAAVTILGALCASVSFPIDAGAQGRVLGGVRTGYYFDQEDAFLGAELLTQAADRLYFNPNVEYVFVENGSYLTLNGDFHYDLASGGSSMFWLGAGLAGLMRNPDGPGSDNNLGANVMLGMGASAGSVIPYLQLKFILSDNTETSLAAGLRF
ncbi:MAG: hypothetical protein ACE15D_03960 [Candidatus Eisenbacteria bacterium]